MHKCLKLLTVVIVLADIVIVVVPIAMPISALSVA